MGHGLRGASISVITYTDGRSDVLHGDELLPYRVSDPPVDNAEAVDEKTLDARFDQVLKRRGSEKYRPAANHPWRRYTEAGMRPTRTGCLGHAHRHD